MLVPIVAGSDKTTVSVATGHQEFHPVYAGVGNMDNSMRRTHSLGLEPIALLPIPKSGFMFHIVDCRLNNLLQLAESTERKLYFKRFAGNSTIRV